LINKIIITSDLQRFGSVRDAFGIESLFSQQIELLTKIKPTVIAHDKASSSKEWEECYFSELACWLETSIDLNSLVIGCELPIGVRNRLLTLGIPFIDIILHPLRFLQDNAFGFLTSMPISIPRTVTDFEISEAVQTIHSCTECMSEDQNTLGRKNVGLIVGQTEYDRTLFVQGKLTNLHTFRKEIKEVSEQHDLVLLKPHPYADPAQLTALKSSNIILTDTNVYKLLSQSEITAVYGISSSVLYEAPHFGKKVTFWGEKWAEGYAPVLPSKFLSVHFWRDLLGQISKVRGLDLVDPSIDSWQAHLIKMGERHRTNFVDDNDPLGISVEHSFFRKMPGFWYS
jgi:hypothetical protein